MSFRRVFAAALVLLSALAVVQAQDSGEVLAEVRIEGTSAYADIVRVVLEARAGRPVASVDLEAERNRVYALGTFREVSVSIEESVVGPVLTVRVEENPLISSVEFEGAESVPDEVLLETVAREHLLDAGRVFNTTRAEEALSTIRRVYRQSGFPFDPPVSLEAQEVDTADGTGMALTYEITESVPLDGVDVAQSQVLEDERVSAAFEPLRRSDEFDFELYRQAIADVEELYRQAGYRASGVDVAASSLGMGRLQVQLQEARIADIDVGELDIDPAELSLAEGDFFNYDVLLEDVHRLAQGRRGDIRLATALTSAGDVRVRFELGPPETAGPITNIVFEGNTVLTDRQLREALVLETGETFTSTLAREDFDRIVRRYAQDGWVILNEPDFSYSEGSYIQRVTEVRIAGYDVDFAEGQANTAEFVVTRYLPEIGSVLNQNRVRAGLRDIARLGVVEPLGANVVQGETPEEAILAVSVRQARTGLFTPSAQYSTDSGLSASISFSESNFLGRAHDVGAELSAQTSDLGFQLGGSLRYSIPWLYIDALDFQQVPTSLSASLFSLVNTNQVLTADGSTRVTYPGLPDSEQNQVRVGEYMQRDTGLSLSVGRPIAPNTSLRFSARASITDYSLEPPRVECTFEAGELENAEECALPEAEAETYLPQGGLNSFVSTTIDYDSRDNPEFPRSGLAATGLVGLGLGTDYRDPVTDQQESYNYQQIELGVKTYLTLASILPEAIPDPNHVLAFRLNAGHQFGSEYPTSRRFQVGKTTNLATAIRGYETDDFDLSRTYATAAMEYRYDFGLETVATQTVIGIVFVDLGYASSVPGYPEYGAPLFAGAGVGVQVNLGFGGIMLPALRFDYGFSERNPGGEFRFRVGPVF